MRLAPFLPWTDRSGRISAVRAVVFALLLVPAALLLVRTVTGDLGARPITEAIHVSGDWAVRLLVASIVVTPLRWLSGRNELIGVRRMIGLWALAWALLHVGLYMADQRFVAATIATEILIRPYLALGAVATLGLVALGVTSTDGMIRRMKAAWGRLHGLVHPIAVLAIVHVFLQSRLDLSQGAILSGVAGAGLAVRLASDRRGRSRLVVAALAIVAAFAVAASMEVLWFWAKTGRNVGPLVAADFDFRFRIAPAWIAAGITFAAVAVALAFGRRDRGRHGVARRPAAPAEA